MIQKLSTVDTVRSIDSILHKPKNTVYSESEYAQTHPLPKSVTDNVEDAQDFSEDQLRNMVEEAKKMMNGVNRQITFKTHEGTGRQLIQLVDTETNEVVREIPPEKMLDVVAGIWQWAGLMIDRK